MSNEAEMKRAREQAVAQYESILELVTRMRAAEEADDYKEQDEAREAIQESALSVQVRSGWYSPGEDRAEQDAEEYEILLCTGGPAVRIIGELNRGSPASAQIQFQDWFTPWTDWVGDLPETYDDDVLMEYVGAFWFGE